MEKPSVQHSHNKSHETKTFSHLQDRLAIYLNPNSRRMLPTSYRNTPHLLKIQVNLPLPIIKPVNKFPSPTQEILDVMVSCAAKSSRPAPLLSSTHERWIIKLPAVVPPALFAEPAPCASPTEPECQCHAQPFWHAPSLSRTHPLK